MSGLPKQYADLNAGTSSMMESSMMEGDGFYTPDTAHTVPGVAVGSWPDKTEPSQLCRVCANPNDYLIPIFNGEGVEHNLSMKIQRHLPIEVRESDSLPVHICYQCATTLMAWHDLVTTCVEADKKLRELQEREEDDDDDKTAQFYEAPSMDSDTGEEPVVQPSTSTTVAKTKVVSSPPTTRKSLASKRPKQKTAPTRLSQRLPSKLLQPAKPKEDSERCPQLNAYQHVQCVLRDNSEELPQWIKVEDNLSDIACKACGDAFSGEGMLKAHLDVSECGQVPESQASPPSGERVLEVSCLMCHKKFGRRLDMVRHFKKHHLASSVVGKSSDMDTPSLQPGVGTSVERESETEEPEEGDLLPKKRRAQCGGLKLNSLEDYELIRQARVVVNGKTLYRCDECGKHLGRYTFFSHLRIHSGEKPYTCHVCGKQFRTAALLNRHVRDVHEGIKRYPCDICGRKFANKRSRDEHRLTHTGERQYVCHLCGKAFKTKASLYVHNMFHLDVFPHECPHCERRFRRRQQLNEHIRLHTGERPFCCHICAKGFRLNHELKRHILIHTSEKTFICSVCGQGFAQERYLKNHGKTHGLRVVTSTVQPR